MSDTFAEMSYADSVNSPFALQWMWPVPLIVGISFAPESPWWLIRQNRISDAKAALGRLTSNNGAVDLDKAITLMVYTTEHEKELGTGTTYFALFRGIDLRRTIITCGCWLIQTLSGASFRYVNLRKWLHTDFPALTLTCSARIRPTFTSKLGFRPIKLSIWRLDSMHLGSLESSRRGSCFHDLAAGRYILSGSFVWRHSCSSSASLEQFQIRLRPGLHGV